jgi:hypothetical protein
MLTLNPVLLESDMHLAPRFLHTYQIC